LRAGLGEISRAAREMAGIARAAKQNPSLQLTAWREAARLFARVHESGNAQWSWTEAERAYRSLSQKARESLSPVALAAAAEAHFALGQSGFESFRKQEIRQPLMATLNRKIALLQAVRKRAEETVAMRQAEPAVCALAQLGEAQMMLGQAIATSPYPPGLNAEQRKLYRDALAEKAQPLSVEARETLKSADARARDLGVNGPCAQRVGSLLEKLAAKAADRPKMSLARSPVLDTPEMVDGRAVQGERARRLLEEALAAAKGLEPAQALEKFQAVAQAEPSPATRFDLAVALDRAGRGQEAEQEYRAAAAAKGVLGYEAAARAASLAAARGDAEAARSALSLSDAALPGIVAGRVLRAELELALGNAVAAQAAAKSALAQAPSDVRALCAMARAALAQGQPGAARIFAARAEKADATDPEPLLVKGEIARAANEPADELAAVRAAVEAAPDAPQAQLALGRALYERGDFTAAADALADAVDMDPASYPAMLAYGQALAQAGQAAEARQALERAVALAPRAPEPHLELARLELDGDGDAQSALREAKLFLSLSTTPPPPGHPVHALVQRCEEALRQASQASVVQTK
ncbi:MAG TPA: tetratricopeptide repeat protein, partial [Myxococcales bacterium]|nr:tetratricopeptide repeat protein [Myxococcales bacterium]